LSEAALAAKGNGRVGFLKPLPCGLFQPFKTGGLFGIPLDECLKRRQPAVDEQAGGIIWLQILWIAGQKKAALADLRILHEAHDFLELAANLQRFHGMVDIGTCAERKRQCSHARAKKHDEGEGPQNGVHLAHLVGIREISPENPYQSIQPSVWTELPSVR